MYVLKCLNDGLQPSAAFDVRLGLDVSYVYIRLTKTEPGTVLDNK